LPETVSNPHTSEETVVLIGWSPYGRNWTWHPEANVLVLSPCLSEAGRERAISELQDHWRKHCIRIVS
jgi:hypothetical protein